MNLLYLSGKWDAQVLSLVSKHCLYLSGRWEALVLSLTSHACRSWPNMTASTPGIKILNFIATLFVIAHNIITLVKGIYRSNLYPTGKP